MQLTEAKQLDILRRHEIGQDAMGMSYYHLSPNSEDSRVYCGKLAEAGSMHWSTLCTSTADIQELSKRFEHTQHEGERKLHSKLLAEILPGLVERSGKFLEQIQIEADAGSDLPVRKVMYYNALFVEVRATEASCCFHISILTIALTFRRTGNCLYSGATF